MGIRPFSKNPSRTRRLKLEQLEMRRLLVSNLSTFVINELKDPLLSTGQDQISWHAIEKNMSIAEGEGPVLRGLPTDARLGQYWEDEIADFPPPSGIGGGISTDFFAEVQWNDIGKRPADVSFREGRLHVTTGRYFEQTGTGAYRLTVWDISGEAPSATMLDGAVTVSVLGQEAVYSTVRMLPVNIQADEGTEFGGEVMRFRDGDGTRNADEYSATIYWPDGDEPSPARVTKVGSDFSIAPITPRPFTDSLSGFVRVHLTAPGMDGETIDLYGESPVQVRGRLWLGSGPSLVETDPVATLSILVKQIAVFTLSDATRYTPMVSGGVKFLVEWGDGNQEVALPRANYSQTAYFDYDSLTRSFSVYGTHIYGKSGHMNIKTTLMEGFTSTSNFITFADPEFGQRGPDLGGCNKDFDVPIYGESYTKHASAVGTSTIVQVDQTVSITVAELIGSLDGTIRVLVNWGDESGLDL